jgi:CheY-like chemotaxis protein
VSDQARFSPHAPARVLLVEDAPDQAYLMSALIEQMGPYQVTVAQDGIHALELVAERAFHLVITDLNLPGMDGFELMRQLKLRHPDLPLLAVTGYDTPAHTEGAHRAGADALLTKPVDRGALLGRLAELLPGATPVASDAPPAVLAVGQAPADVVLGCGGSLLAHARAGHRVAAAVIEGELAEALQGLGAEVLDLGADPADALRALELLVPPAGTRLAYLPSPRDEDAARRGLFELCRVALAEVPKVLGYATVTSTLEFRPDGYREVGDHLEAKLEVLARAAPEGEGPSPAFARAHALYWGRFAGFTAVEPFETLRVLPNEARGTS